MAASKAPTEMAHLMGELYIWSLKNQYLVSDRDIGCHVYHDKGEAAKAGAFRYYEEKRQYTESRQNVWTPRNKRPDRLRDQLKEFEEILNSQDFVYTRWKTRRQFQVLLTNGILVTFLMTSHSGDVQKIVADKTLVSKLGSDITICDAVITEDFILLSYADKPKVTLVYFNKKPAEGLRKLEKISSSDPKISHIDLPSSHGRKVKRKLSVNMNSEWGFVWWASTGDEVWPWVPMTSVKEKSNLIMLGITNGKLEELANIPTECNPLSMSFSSLQPRHILSVEKSASRELAVDTCIYECSRTKIVKASTTTIAVDGEVLVQSRNALNDKLMLACENGFLVLYDGIKRLTYSSRASFVPSFICWHPEGSLMLLANTKGEIECFDMALNSVYLCLLSEEPSPTRVLNLSRYFRLPSILRDMKWCIPSFASPVDATSGAQDAILLMFERGPVVILQMFMGVITRGHLRPQDLIANFMRHEQSEEAVNLLNAMNWNATGTKCLLCLNTIINCLLKLPLTPEREASLEAALGSFYAPRRRLSDPVIVEFRDPVSRLARRFFHHLLRHERVEKAFLLAVDIHSRDLFMDIHYLALDMGEHALAETALKKAEDLDNEFSASASDSEESDSDSQSYDDEDSYHSYEDDTLPDSREEQLYYETRYHLRYRDVRGASGGSRGRRRREEGYELEPRRQYAESRREDDQFALRERPPERPQDLPMESTPDRSQDRAQGRHSDMPADSSIERPQDRPMDRPPDRPMIRPQDRPMDKAQDGLLDRPTESQQLQLQYVDLSIPPAPEQVVKAKVRTRVANGDTPEREEADFDHVESDLKVNMDKMHLQEVESHAHPIPNDVYSAILNNAGISPQAVQVPGDGTKKSTTRTLKVIHFGIV